MPKVTLIVTGDKQIDRALRRFAFDDNKGAKKAIRQAARKATKDIVLKDYRSRVPVASGTMRDVAKVRAVKRSRTRVGYRVHIDRDKLFQMYRKRTGREPGKRRGGKEPFFYPSVIELGSSDTSAKKPLRKALYDNAGNIRTEFLKYLRAAIRAAGRLV